MQKKITDVNFLIKSLSSEIEKGRLKIQSDSDKQKTLSYWNIGSLINDHLKYHADDNEYGLNLFTNLSKNLGIAKRTLYFSIQLNKTYGLNHSLFDHLSWTHFRILLSIKSKEKRKKYEKILETSRMSTRDFFLLVKNNETDILSYNPDKLNFIKGIPNTYKIKHINNKPFIDLGFHIYSDEYFDMISTYEDETVIQSVSSKNIYSIEKKETPLSSLYTYKAFIIKVIDADTLHVNIDLGFNLRATQRLRLRGIDAPSLTTPSGQNARDFVLSEFNGLDFIVIKTYHTDIYSRYLTDIFYKKNEADMLSVINSGSFLNQKLLDEKMAERYYAF